MIGRIVATCAAAGFAVGGFLGSAPGTGAGPFNPFGWLFVVIAFVVWRYWAIITGNFSPGRFDSLVGGLVDRSGTDPRGNDERRR